MTLVYKIIIWGTGDEYQKLYNIVKYEELKKNIEIVAIVDKNKWQRKLDGYPVIFPIISNSLFVWNRKGQI